MFNYLLFVIFCEK